MNAIEQRLIALEKRAMTPRNVLCGLLVTGTFWYTLSAVDDQKFIILAAALLATGVLCVSLYTRLRAQERWQAAWEKYAEWDLNHHSFDSHENEKPFSLAGTN